MTIVVLTDCPPRIRGDLTKWMMEINAGVYVGNINSRIRDQLWERICSCVSAGRVTMVYQANNEQRMKFRVHNTTWEPVDYDGLTLMRRPLPQQRPATDTPGFLPEGFSKAAHQQKARRMAKQRSTVPDSYVVIDIETTGVRPAEDEIIELAAIRIEGSKVTGEFHQLIRSDHALPDEIVKLTGITDEELREHGECLSTVLPRFLAFIGQSTLVSHNAAFDQQFLFTACRRLNLQLFHNQLIDTLALSRRKVKDVPNYRLESLASHFRLVSDHPHRALSDCYTTYELLCKLNEI